MSVTETPLPPELEREIFQYTAELYPNAIPRLLCVAHRVLVWIEPMAYHTINVDSSKRFLAFMAASKVKPPEFFAKHARRILIDKSFAGPLKDACAALALCTNATRIAGVHDSLSRLLLPVIIPMRLERIALFLTDIFPKGISAVDLSLPCFQTLTHLDIYDSVSDEHDAMVYATKLCALPALTHLSLSDLVSWEAVQKLSQGYLEPDVVSPGQICPNMGTKWSRVLSKFVRTSIKLLGILGPNRVRTGTKAPSVLSGVLELCVRSAGVPVAAATVAPRPIKYPLRLGLHLSLEIENPVSTSSGSRKRLAAAYG
ncbi:hypothetical protein C8F01DRAFT_1351575 [Mycena amicta]|nr:hypothetical protein C8F01DRAFT_1351575 [Mycena amicta]